MRALKHSLNLALGAIFVLSLIPFQQSSTALLTVTVFLSQIATTLVVVPLGELMARSWAKRSPALFA